MEKEGPDALEVAEKADAEKKKGDETQDSINSMGVWGNQVS